MLKNKKDIVIKKCTHEKDLGVTFDDNLQFDAHVQRVINQTNSMIGIISRTFTYLNKRILVNLNKTLVRPHLEFGNEIWFPTKSARRNEASSLFHYFRTNYFIAKKQNKNSRIATNKQ